MSYIDAHVHVWTDDYDRFPFKPGVQPPPEELRVFHPEDLLSHARASGVDRIVLVQMSYYGSDNSYMLHTMRRYPDRFAGIGIVDVDADRPDAQMVELSRAGVRGLRIVPRGEPAAKRLDTDGYRRLFAAAADNGMALCALIDPDSLPALERRCAQFPEAPVVIDHLCRIGASGTVEPADVAALCRMARYPKVMVKVSAFYALGRKSPPYDDLAPLIQAVYEAFGAERLMWGSDSPYQVQDEHSYEASLALVRDRLAFLSAADREMILRGTAAKLFF